MRLPFPKTWDSLRGSPARSQTLSCGTISTCQTQKEYMSQPLQYLFLVRVVEDRFGLATSVPVFYDQSSQGTEFFLVLSLTQNGALHPSLVMDFVCTYLTAL